MLVVELLTSTEFLAGLELCDQGRELADDGAKVLLDRDPNYGTDAGIKASALQVLLAHLGVGRHRRVSRDRCQQ